MSEQQNESYEYSEEGLDRLMRAINFTSEEPTDEQLNDFIDNMK